MENGTLRAERLKDVVSFKEEEDYLADRPEHNGLRVRDDGTLARSEEVLYFAGAVRRKRVARQVLHPDPHVGDGAAQAARPPSADGFFGTDVGHALGLALGRGPLSPGD